MPLQRRVTSRGVELRVVIFVEEDTWGCQCLEYDIGAQGKTYDIAISRLKMVIEAEAQISEGLAGFPFAGIDPAPECFHRMWKEQTQCIKSP